MDVDWTRVDHRRFEELCHDMARVFLPPEDRTLYRPESMPHQADFQRDGLLEDCEFEKLKPPVFFSFKTSDPSRSAAQASAFITRAFLARRQALLAGNPKSIVLWTNHNMRPRDKEAIRKAIPRRIAIRIEGRDQLEYRLLQRPFLLTKYFGWSEFVSCWQSGDRPRLRRALLGDALAESVPLEGVPHPARQKIESPVGKRLRIVGAPGCGKSFFLYQLLAAFGDADVVVLKSLVLTEVADHLRQLVQSARRHLVVVVDNLHEQVSKLQHFAEVLGILLSRPEHSQLPVTVLVTHWSSKRPEVERSAPQTLWDSWGFEEVNLDNPSRQFIAAVVRAACEHLQIEAEDGMQEAFVEEIIGWENTPACAVASLLPYQGKSLRGEHGFHPVMLKVRSDAWRHLFRELQNTGTPEETTLLRTVSVLRWSGKPRPDINTVREIATQVGGASDATLDYALERLETAGWVQRDGTVLSSHDLQVFPATVGLYEEGRPSLFLSRFTEMVIRDELPCVRSERVDVLHHLGEMFWNMGDIEKCIELNDVILATDPLNLRALCNRGVSLAKVGKVDEGLSDLRKATEIAPSEVGPARVRYTACRRCGRKDDAMETLRFLQQHLPHDSPDLAFLALSLADLGETEAALACARRLSSARPDSSEAIAALVQVTHLAGQRERALALVDGALGRFPDDGLLLFVKADIESQNRGAEGVREALPLAERALRARPNNPSIFALVAMLHLLAGNDEKAAAVAEAGTELFKFWPDLLTVRGLTLEQKGDLHEARQVLLQAVEKSETLSGWYRPNLLLGLGRVSIRLGDVDEAERWFGQAEREGVEKSFMLTTKAEAFRVAGSTAEAIRALEQVVSLVPDSHQSWWALADSCARVGRLGRAIEALQRADSLRPDDWDTLYCLAHTLKRARRYGEAVRTLRRAVELDAERGEAWSDLGVCLSRLGQHEEAAPAFEKAIKRGNLGTTDELAYAYSLHKLGRQDEALRICQRIEAGDPNDCRAIIIEAACYLARGEPRAAKKTADKALALGRDDEDVCFELIQLYLRMGHTEDAVTVWLAGRKRGWAGCALSGAAANQMLEFLQQQSRHADAMEVIQHIDEAYGPNETNLLNLARCAAHLGRDEQALEAYNNLVKLNPLNLSAVSERAELLVRMGQGDDVLSSSPSLHGGLPPWLMSLHLSHAAVAARDSQQATDHFVAAVTALPDPPLPKTLQMSTFAEIAEHLGIRPHVEERLGLGDGTVPEHPAEAHLSAHMARTHEEQLRRLRAARKLGPDRLLLALDLAMAELHFGDRQEAVRLAREVAESEPPLTVSLASAGRILMLAGVPPEETLALAERSLELAQAGDSALWSAQHLKAESLNALGRFEESLPVAEAALDSSETPLTMMAVLRSLRGLGRFDEALQLAEKALVAYPDDIEIKATKALLLNLEGRDEECIEFVQSIGAAGVIMITPLLDMADCLMRVERYEEAATAYESARKNLENSRGSKTLEDFYIRAVKGEVSAAVKQGKEQQALGILDALGEAYLVNTPLWLLKAGLCIELELYGQAISSADARAEAVPTDPSVPLLRAEVLWKTGKMAEALAEVDMATQLEGKETPSALNLKARILADMSHVEEAVGLLACEMEARAAASQEVELAALWLATTWLPKCNPPPLVGLQMGAAWLGVVCMQHGKSDEARSLLEKLVAIDWSAARRAAEGGNRASCLALAMLDKAEGHLQQEVSASPHVDQVVASDNQPAPSTSALEVLLQHLLQADWPGPAAGQ